MQRVLQFCHKQIRRGNMPCHHKVTTFLLQKVLDDEELGSTF